MSIEELKDDPIGGKSITYEDEIILKHCRDTHCHFCFNELPADSVPCTACSIPLYCSQHCQMQAGGQELRNNSKNHGICKNLSSDLEKYVAGITLPKDSDSNIEWIAEHKHECKGVNWPAVLPPEIVLAGRVMVKSVEQKNILAMLLTSWTLW
ncbi:hypothetical protein CK203_038151 [Vitis vinifera]|uniref:MYND-type domain-containing protein n=1 Tax=Vitis vinifera TaxID=29760 RepID=A0A438HA64_VITVI|nr:hypothetical protein CK203_038151 [Vitis vinifera]